MQQHTIDLTEAEYLNRNHSGDLADKGKDADGQQPLVLVVDDPCPQNEDGWVNLCQNTGKRR